jgi:hypothetical protein
MYPGLVLKINWEGVVPFTSLKVIWAPSVLAAFITRLKTYASKMSEVLEAAFRLGDRAGPRALPIADKC